MSFAEHFEQIPKLNKFRQLKSPEEYPVFGWKILWNKSWNLEIESYQIINIWLRKISNFLRHKSTF